MNKNEILVMHSSKDWKEFRLGDLTTWASGSTPSKQNPSFWGGKIPWISGTVMRSKNLSESELYLTEEGLENKGKLCKKDSVLLLVRGDLFKRIPIGIATKSLSFNQDIKAINSVSNDLLQHYLYYLLEGNKKRLSNIVEFTGLGAGKLDTKLLQDLTFKIPPIHYQKNLIKFIDSIDSKIELKKESNKNLEEIAKALFKSWFIDFDPVNAKSEGRSTGLPDGISDLFPNSFEEVESRKIPNGWSVNSIYELAKVIYGAPFSSKLFNNDGRGIPLVRIRDLKKGNPGFWTEEIHPNGCLIEPGDIVVGMDGEFRTYLWDNQKCWMNQRICKFVPYERINNCFLRYSISKPLLMIERSETATTVIHLGKSDIDSFRVIFPCQKIQKLFGEITEPIEKSIIRNNQETRTLNLLREILVPKLISGELKIEDAEIMIEEVVI